MKTLLHATAVALVLSAAPAFAQTAEDPATDTTSDTGTTGTETETATQETESEGEGFFSRMIPAGLKGYFTDEEEADFQARLDEAQTPQERNAVRQELQRMNQERHLEQVQATKREQLAVREQRREEKGFFASMREDFGSIVDGKASERGFSRGEREAGPSDRQTANANSSERGKSSDRGKSGSSGGGKSGGGKSGGNGGGKNK